MSPTTEPAPELPSNDFRYGVIAAAELRRVANLLDETPVETEALGELEALIAHARARADAVDVLLPLPCGCSPQLGETTVHGPDCTFAPGMVSLNHDSDDLDGLADLRRFSPWERLREAVLHVCRRRSGI